MRLLVLGGARSGKSHYAQQFALATNLKLIYLATATAEDEEMQRRITRHQQQRSRDWQTIEEPIHLAAKLIHYSNSETCIVVDCLTLWLNNILFNQQGDIQKAFFESEMNALLDTLTNLTGTIILISNEVGTGIIPMGENTRRFVDEAGFLHQHLAKLCDQVIFMTAGLAQQLK